MRRLTVWALFVVLLLAALSVPAFSQQIDSTYADLTVPGNWQLAKQYAGGSSGSDIYFDANTGAILLISQQAGLRKVAEIAQYFAGNTGSNAQASGVMSSGQFPLPPAYVDRASKDLAKGSKPPKIWDLKDGDGNPLWFYDSQLFEEYRMHGGGTSSEISEQFANVRVTKAEQRAVRGGDVLLFEVETDKPANDVAMKRFHMPAGLKDQRVRYGWVQFAPGGIASGQGVLSVAFGVAANSSLKIDDVAKQVSEAKVKTL
ncbi:MAG TPA: hypothetical protein VE779_03110 [Candidatus Angelobacter sp.]|nr:hypothetical protein [Candidatus Angelobacter sp.]